MNIVLDKDVAFDATTVAPAPRRFASWTSAPPPVREYHSIRVLTPVLLSPQAPTSINVWRLRETRCLVDWLRGRSAPADRVADIAGRMDQQPNHHCWSLLREGLEDLYHELGDREVDRTDVLEWLAEWGRDPRKPQTGLLHLPARGAKELGGDGYIWHIASNPADEDGVPIVSNTGDSRASKV